MRFGSILGVVTLVSSALVGAAPTHKDAVDLQVRHDMFDVDVTVRELEQLNERAATGLSKRDDDFISSLLLQLDLADLLDSFIDKLSNNSKFTSTITSEVTSALASKSVNVTTIVDALSESDLLENFFSSILSDTGSIRTSLLKYAKQLFQSGKLTSSSKRSLDIEDMPVHEVSLSKRDGEFLTKIVNAITDSGLVSKIVLSVLNNQELISGAKNLLVSAFKKINWSSLYTTIKNSGIVQSLWEKALTSIKSRVALVSSIESASSSSTRRKRADDDTSNVGALAIAALGSASATTTEEATSTEATESDSGLGNLVDNLLGATSAETETSTQATAEASETSTSTTTGGGIAGLIGNLFGGDDETTTTTSSEAESSETASSGLGSLIDSLLGNDDDESTTTTSTELESTETGSLFEDLLGAFLDSDDNSTATTTTAKSTSTGLIIDDLLLDLLDGSSSNSTFSGSTFLKNLIDNIFDDDDSSNSTSSSSSSSLIDDILDLAGDGLDKLFDGNSTSGIGLGVLATLLGLAGDFVGDLFSGDGAGTKLISSLLGLAGDALEDLFNGIDFSLESFFTNLINKIFGSSSSSSGLSSDDSLLGDIIDSLFDGNFSLLDLVDELIEKLFGGSSSSGTSSATTTSVFATKQKCCCGDKKRRVRKRELKKHVRRTLRKAIKKRHIVMAHEQHINAFAQNLL